MMAAPCAYAQSSVTLYGIIDAGIRYLSNLNGHGTFVANDGSIQSNRWGLLGSEDLGRGAKAIFQLENGFNLYNGTMVQSGQRRGFRQIDDDRPTKAPGYCRISRRAVCRQARACIHRARATPVPIDS
ncbi:MAG: hypothetical protein QOD67_3618 [Caballeronia sp.]|nr:hypothetical protein [Caballeronia sp.]